MKKVIDSVTVAADEKDFSAVLTIITTHRSRALMSVNVENLLTYWEIGAFLSPRIHSGSWSTAIVGRLADYIKRNQPELRGYGKSNLYNMALLYDTFSSDGFLGILERYKSVLPKGANFFQIASGKSREKVGREEKRALATVSGAVKAVSNDTDIFQTAFGKSIPEILFCISCSNLMLIAAHCTDVQEMLFYIVYSLREHLTYKQMQQALAHDTYVSLLGGDKKNYSKKLKELLGAERAEKTAERAEKIREWANTVIPSGVRQDARSNMVSILQEVGMDKFATTEKLMQATGLSDRGVRKIVASLKDLGVLVRIGPDKGGHWEIEMGDGV